MAKFYMKPELEEKDGHLFSFNGLEISFTVKSHDLNGNPVLKVFDKWGNYAYVKGSDAYRYSYDYDKYVGSMGSLYRFKSRCPEMDRLEAYRIQTFAEDMGLTIEESAKTIENWGGNIWKFSPDTVRIAKGVKLYE